MPGYSARLQLEIIRRDAALGRMNCSGIAAAADVQAKLDRTAEAVSAFVSREIEHARDVVGAQIDHAKDAYSREVEHTRTTIDTTLNGLGSGLNPANIVQAHPWGTTLGVLVAAALLAPLLKKLFLPPAPDTERVDPGTSSEASAKDNGTHHPKRDPLMDALLAGIPWLAAALAQLVAQPTKARSSNLASDVCPDSAASR